MGITLAVLSLTDLTREHLSTVLIVMCLLYAGERVVNDENRVCNNPDCKKHFVAKVYNSIYCSPECRKIITNKKLLENYYEKKANKDKKRKCKTKECITTLSRYNKENICERCKRERYVKRLVGWGWDESRIRDGLD
jgi:hypothetical protein